MCTFSSRGAVPSSVGILPKIDALWTWSVSRSGSAPSSDGMIPPSGVSMIVTSRKLLSAPSSVGSGPSAWCGAKAVRLMTRRTTFPASSHIKKGSGGNQSAGTPPGGGGGKWPRKPLPQRTSEPLHGEPPSSQLNFASSYHPAPPHDSYSAARAATVPVGGG